VQASHEEWHRVTFCAGGNTLTLPADRVAASAYATGSDSEGEEVCD